MEGREFDTFASGWAKAGGIPFNRVVELTESARQRYEMRKAAGYSKCGDDDQCRKKLILELQEARRQKMIRAQQAIKLCKID